MDRNERRVGTVSRGIRCPIIREGDDLAQIVTDSVLEAAQIEGFEIRDRDVISITESIVARAQGNYAAVTARAQGNYAAVTARAKGMPVPDAGGGLLRRLQRRGLIPSMRKKGARS